MIQRIQSLYLLISAVATSLVLFLPLYVTEIGGSTLTVDVMGGKLVENEGGTLEETGNIYVLILTLACVALSIGTIFLYKNRPTQMKLARFVGLLNTGLLVSIMFFAVDSALAMSSVTSLLESTEQQGGYQPYAFLPIIGMVLGLLAGRAILKDEALVRASSRFR